MTTTPNLTIESAEADLTPFMVYGDRKFFMDYRAFLWPNPPPTPPDKTKYFVDITTHLIYDREVSPEDLPVISEYIADGYTVKANNSNITATLYKNEVDAYNEDLAKYEDDLLKWYEQRKNAEPVLQSMIDKAISCKENFRSNEKVQRLIAEGKIKL